MIKSLIHNKWKLNDYNDTLARKIKNEDLSYRSISWNRLVMSQKEYWDQYNNTDSIHQLKNMKYLLRKKQWNIFERRKNLRWRTAVKINFYYLKSFKHDNCDNRMWPTYMKNTKRISTTELNIFQHKDLAENTKNFWINKNFIIQNIIWLPRNEKTDN